MTDPTDSGYLIVDFPDYDPGLERLKRALVSERPIMYRAERVVVMDLQMLPTCERIITWRATLRPTPL